MRDRGFMPAHVLRPNSTALPSPVGVLYVKFTADAITEFLLLSFKEKDHE